MPVFVFELNEVNEAADWLIAQAGQEKIWLLEGEMGAGKTTLVKAIALKMGVQGHVQSPTFAIVNEYLTDLGETIYHFDCYRIKNDEEAFDIGIEEYLDAGKMCWIEWPDKIENFLPEKYFKVIIQKTDESSRTLVVD